MSRVRVEVYWNLHKDCWSVRSPGGKVFMHARHVWMKDVEWTVQPAGTAKVRAEGKKNVHAFARGVLVDAITLGGEQADRAITGAARRLEWWHHVDRMTGRARYNPYTDTTFMRQWGTMRIPLRSSAYALLVTEMPEALAPMGRAYYVTGNPPASEDFNDHP